MAFITVGKKKYHTGIQSILKDRELHKAFREFAKAKHINEIYYFLTTVFEPKKHYPVFIRSDGKYAINIDGTLRKKMTDIVENKDLNEQERWDKAVWRPHIMQCKSEMRDLLKDNYLTLGGTASFWHSVEFAKVARKNIGMPAKAAELLGIQPKNIKVLEDLMYATAINNKQLIGQHSDELKRLEKKTFTPKELQKLMK